MGDVIGDASDDEGASYRLHRALAWAFASFVWLLVLAVGDLELGFGSDNETSMITGQKIGAHKAIYAWVTNCETSLGDRGQPAGTRPHCSGVDVP